MKDRILQIMKKEDLSAAQFAEKIGISQASLSHILNGRNNPSLDVVIKVRNAFQNINLDWFLFGTGDMYKPVVTSDFPNLFDSQIDENSNFPSDGSEFLKNRKEIDFENPENDRKNVVHQEVKYVELPSKKITEIRIFFDNGTYETFKPA
jgi:transcriptional regulator with XRE-family HTH domain